MEKLPAIQFYPADWRKDPGVQSLTFHQRGVWFEMICLMHESPRRGYLLLPTGKAISDEQLGRLIGLDKQTLTSTLTALIDCGVTSRDPATDALICRRMIRDEEIRRIRQAAGSKGGNPRLLNQSSNQTPNQSPKQKPTPSSSSSTSTSVPPLPPEGVEEEKGEDVRKGEEIAERFEEFWKAYPENRRKNRYRAEQAFSCVRHHLPSQSVLLGALAAFCTSKEWRKEEGKFIPSPWTWLEERRWQDAPAFNHKAGPEKPKSSVDEDDAFRWRSEQYPESLEVHPTPATFPFEAWPKSTQREYLATKSQPQPNPAA